MRSGSCPDDRAPTTEFESRPTVAKSVAIDGQTRRSGPYRGQPQVNGLTREVRRRGCLCQWRCSMPVGEAMHSAVLDVVRELDVGRQRAGPTCQRQAPCVALWALAWRGGSQLPGRRDGLGSCRLPAGAIEDGALRVGVVAGQTRRSRRPVLRRRHRTPGQRHNAVPVGPGGQPADRGEWAQMNTPFMAFGY